MFFVNMKSQNILKDRASNSFNFPDAKRKELLVILRGAYEVRATCKLMLSLSAIADLKEYARTV